MEIVSAVDAWRAVDSDVHAELRKCICLGVQRKCRDSSGSRIRGIEGAYNGI